MEYTAGATYAPFGRAIAGRREQVFLQVHFGAVYDENGCVHFRGFYGDYDLQLGDQTTTFRLSAKEDNHLTVTV